MKKNIITLTFLFAFVSYSFAQGLLSSVYPIGERPSMGWKSSMVPETENMIFEANPFLRIPLYTNIVANLRDNRNFGWTGFISFQPRIRMYHDISKPVRTPSYNIRFAGQFSFRLNRLPHSSNKVELITFGYETGHFSNGQDRCAFCPDFVDGSLQCDSIYSTITPETNLSEILNRSSGNFSTNLSEIVVNYRLNNVENHRTKSSLSLSIGYTRYHNNLLYIFNIGGYSENDIQIYGRNRFNFGVEYMWPVTLFSRELRGLLSFNYELIHKPHKQINPHRFELTSTVFTKENLGFFASAIYGHDNYNFRFVDSGFQIFVGITFDIFPPIELRGNKPPSEFNN